MKDNEQGKQSDETKKIYDVFVSYRRERLETARSLVQALEKRGLRVFFDLEELDDGNFNEKLYDAIDQSKNAIFLMTKGALDGCAREGDWVRNELEHVLKSGIKLILVNPSDVTVSFPDTLPSSLQSLGTIQVTKLDLGTMFNDSVNKVVKRLEGVRLPGKKIDDDLPVLGKPVDEVALSGLRGQDAKHLKKALGYYNVVRYRSALAEFERVEDRANPFVRYYVLLIKYLLDGNVKDGDLEDACCAARDCGCTDAMRLFADRHLPNDTKAFDPVPPDECIEWLRKAIANGNSDALADLGVAYENALGVKEDLVKARELYKQSCEAGSLVGKMAYGQDCLLGNAGEKDLVEAGRVLRPIISYLQKHEDELTRYEYNTLLIWYSPFHGNIVKPNPALAEKYAELIIASKGCSINGDLSDKGAAYMLCGCLCLQATEDPEKAKLAFEFFQKEKEAYDKDGWADFGLGHCYDNGIGVEVDAGRALECYESAAEKGCAAAQYVLATKLLGDDSEQDIERGKMLLKLAAEGGDSDAEHLYGLWLIRGVHFEKNVEEGMKWLEKAAVHENDADAMNSLGEQYRDGTDGVEIDYEKAFKWFGDGATGGSTDAMQSLGWAYLRGQGTTRDVGEAEKWFVRAAKKGGADEKNTLGTRYYNGDFGEPDVKRALDWIRKAANEGSVFAMNNAGEMCRDGDGGEKNIDEALKWFQSAAKEKHPDAMVNLGWIYLNGDGVDKDVKKAEEWFVKAAKTHDINAEIILGIRYYNGDFGENNFEEARKWWELAADQGNEVAMNYLGEMYRDGEGASKNIELALKWFKDAVGKGSLAAMSNLGWLYLREESYKDLAEAEKWFVMAARTGDADAECGLGTRYAKGAFGKVDYIKAKEWWEKAATHEDLAAMNNLGIVYQRGEDGVPQDRRQAFAWFERAAKAGSPDAMEALGLAYLSGIGTVVDEEKAKEWLVKAAEKGNASAECSLGTRYAEGEFGEKDFKEAVDWWRKAAKNGDTTAMCNLGHVFSDPDLSDNVIQIDLEEAREWYHKADDAGSEYAAYYLGLDVLGVLGNRSETYAEWQEAFKASNLEVGPAKRVLRKAGSWLWKPLDAHADNANLAGACLRWLARIARYQEDLENAKDLYRQAAEKGDEKAKKELAEIDTEKCGVEEHGAVMKVPAAAPVVMQGSAESDIPSPPQAAAVQSSPEVPSVSSSDGETLSQVEAVFLRKVRLYKKNDGQIDETEEEKLRKWAEEFHIPPLRREELILQVEEEYEMGK